MRRIGYVCAIYLLCVALVIWVFVARPFSGREREKLGIYLVFTYNSGLFGEQLWKGAELAAGEEGDQFMQQFVQAEALEDQLRRLKENGADGVLCYGDAAACARLRAVCKSLRLPYVQFAPEEEGASVWNDERELGAQAARDAARRGRGLVVLAGEDAVSLQRLEGLQGALKEDCACVTLTPDGDGRWQLDPQARRMLEEGACLVTLSPEATNEMLLQKEQGTLDADIPLVGVNGQYAIDALETGRAEMLLYSTPFALGYMGYTKLREMLLEGAAAETVRTPYLEITLDNLYDDQNIRAVFPLLE